MLLLEELPATAWRRIKRFAAYLTMSAALADDLRQEALFRAVDGTRHCPRNLDVVIFVYQTMRSIVYAERKSDRKQPTVQLELVGDREIREAMGPDDPGAEALMLMTERSAEIRMKILSLFDDDETTKLVMEGIMAEMEGEELCELAGIDATGLATRRRLIRRRVDKAYPSGWFHDA